MAPLDLVLALVLGAALVIAIKLFLLSPKPSAPSAAAAAGAKKATAAGSPDSTSASGKPKCTILFGSQSGTAENFAYDLAEEGKMFGFDTLVVDLEEFNPADFAQEKFVVFVVATFGEGDPTDNAQNFWDYVTSPLPERDPNDISGTSFAVFALGNRQYQHFCAVGKRIDKELGDMGGDRLLPVGIGDDDSSLEQDFEAWRPNFWAAARVKFGTMSEDEAKSGVSQFRPLLNVAFHPADSQQARNYQGGMAAAARFFNDPAKDHRTAIVTIAEARELRPVPQEDLCTAHLELSLEGTKLAYRTADNLGVHPTNDLKLAGRLAKRLNVSFNAVFSVKTSGTRKIPVPGVCSVEDALLYFCDLNSCPRGRAAALLAAYTQDATEQRTLRSYADNANADAFHALRYNWVELLEAFPGVELPFAHFLEMVPRLQPRYYTIASSNKVQPQRVAVTCARFVRPKPSGRKHVGVCSDLLCNAIGALPASSSSTSAPAAADSAGPVSSTAATHSSAKLIAYVRPSSFRLPARGGTPIIMVGPGTGIAPFRGFLQEFRTRQAEHKFGTTALYFGCRHPDQDYIYREELETALKDGVLSELHLAFSRQDPGKVVYVQNLLAQNAASTWSLIEKGAYIYVCGGTSMGRDVRQVLEKVIKVHGGMTEAAAATYLDKMARSGRFVQELWSS